jgi:predicted aspartyl protease
MKRTISVPGAAALLLALCFSAIAHDGVSQPATVSAGLANRVDADLQKGDERDLGRLYQIADDPLSHVVAAMALERLHLNLDQSSEDAAACEKVLRKTRPDIAFYCALFASGNTRLAGRTQEADRMDVATAQRYAGTYKAADLAKLEGNAGKRAEQPQLLVRRPGHTLTLPLLRPAFGNGEPFIDASANGKSARLLLDTGASSLLLDERTARDWGVHMLEGGDEHIQGFFSKDVAVHRGWLDHLDLGGISMENVPVEVGSKGSRIIGIDLLRWLGAMRIGKDRLTVYAGDDTRPACSEPMVVASPRYGNYLRMITTVPVDGNPQTALLDTGFTGYLSGNAAVLEQYKDGLTGHARFTDVSASEHKAGIKLATQTVVISGQPIKMTFVVFTDANLPWGFVLGNLALQDMDFYFDFDNRHTCLLLHDNLH